MVDVLRHLDVHSYRARFLSLTTERGLPELVIDALVLLAAVLTARLFLRTGLRGFLFLAGLLSCIAVDDFFALHESFGFYVAGQLEYPEIAGISANAWGELTFVILFGLVCTPFSLGRLGSRKTLRSWCYMVRFSPFSWPLPSAWTFCTRWLRVRSWIA